MVIPLIVAALLGLASPAQMPTNTAPAGTNGVSVPVTQSQETPIRIAGVVSLEVFPGRPNYESIKNGDEAEKVWVLTTAKGGTKERFQLVVINGPEPKLATLRQSIGKRVEVEGVAWEAFSGHHHTARLLTVRSVHPSGCTEHRDHP
jgi:hypothetical protein